MVSWFSPTRQTWGALDQTLKPWVQSELFGGYSLVIKKYLRRKLEEQFKKKSSLFKNWLKYSRTVLELFNSRFKDFSRTILHNKLSKFNFIKLTRTLLEYFRAVSVQFLITVRTFRKLFLKFSESMYRYISWRLFTIKSSFGNSCPT